MPTFKIRFETKVPVLWDMVVVAADEEAARVLAMESPYGAADGDVLSNEWSGDNRQLFFDWEADSVVNIEFVERLRRISDGKGLWWNNAQGWVGADDAELFDGTEMINLPMGGQWED